MVSELVDVEIEKMNKRVDRWVVRRKFRLTNEVSSMFLEVETNEDNQILGLSIIRDGTRKTLYPAELNALLGVIFQGGYKLG